MAELLTEYSTRIKAEDGTMYTIRAYGSERSDGTWSGWVEFHPANGGTQILRTGQETSQPSRVTIEYWASGLEPVYLKGAFARAQGKIP